MTCSACCAAIESALDALPGVTNAVLSLIQQQARIEYHPNLMTPVSSLLGPISSDRPQFCSTSSQVHGDMPLRTHLLCAEQEQLLKTIEEVGFETRLLGSGDDSTTRLSIGGMTCSSCSSAIESTLKGTEGIRGVSVSLITSTAEVGSRSLIAQLWLLPHCTIGRAVKKQSPLLQHAHTAEKMAHISGYITLDSEESLFRIVQVQYDSALVGARDIIAVVSGLGYEASLLQNDELSAGLGEREKEKRFWRQKVMWSLLFSVPVFLLAMVFTYLPRVKDGLNTSVGGFTVNELVQWILTTPVQVHCFALPCM